MEVPKADTGFKSCQKVTYYCTSFFFKVYMTNIIKTKSFGFFVENIKLFSMRSKALDFYFIFIMIKSYQDYVLFIFITTVCEGLERKTSPSFFVESQLVLRFSYTSFYLEFLLGIYLRLKYRSI